MSMGGEVHTVEVEGGDLTFEVLAGSTAPVLCVHGVSSQRYLWSWLRAEAPELQLVAPDLRGRGDSFGIKGDSSMTRHADDLIAVLDALGVTTAHVCGMSMGGFVAVELAARHPERTSSLILVDGGFPMAVPPGMTREALRPVFANRYGRIERRWDTLDEYKAFFLEGTAPLLDPGDPLIDAYLAHDLRDGIVRLSGEALTSDAEDVFFGTNRLAEVAAPIRFLHAEWSSGSGTAPGYGPDLVSRYRARTVTTTLVPGVDHAGIIMSPKGASATAVAVRAALDA